MIQAYAIDLRPKWTEADLTVELYGCNLKCRFCCSNYGKRLTPCYHGNEEIFERITAVAGQGQPQLVRFTGGEFSLHGVEAIELYLRLASAFDLPIVIETNVTRIGFYEVFSTILGKTGAAAPLFIVSVKAAGMVTSGEYDTEQIVANIRRLYQFFAHSYVAHGFIGFGKSFRTALLYFYPELIRYENQIYKEGEGRHRFEALRVSDGSRDLYYFDQRIRVPQRKPLRVRGK